MSAKQLLFSDEARQKMVSGVNQLAKAVTTTLGPKGRNVAIDKQWGAPEVLHDGVSVAKEITLEDKFENMGAQLAKQAAEKTNKEAGDGTTTATLLVEQITNKGMRHVTAGVNPMIMKKGIDKAVVAVVKEIRRLAKPVTESDWEKVATISAQDEVIGQKIAEAIKLVGENGVIEVEEGNEMDITISHKEGMVLDNGYASPYFAAGTENMEIEMKNANILVTDQKITNINELVPFLEKFMLKSRDLVIICEDITPEALIPFIKNKLDAVLNVLVIKAPGFGEYKKALLQDIAILTGAELASAERGISFKDLTPDHLGKADLIKCNKEETTIVGGNGSKENIDGRVKLIDQFFEEATSEHEKNKLAERKAKLVGGVASIQVGAATESEMKNLVERVKDAKEATKAAIEEGIIPGGGTILLEAIKVLDKVKVSSQEEQVGVDIIREVAEEPLRMLAENSGKNSGWIVGVILNANTPQYGFNALTGEFEDMVEAGIIEPAKVATSSLINAASAANMILTTECLITDVPKKETTPVMPGMM